jgi:hypothetical protein
MQRKGKELGIYELIKGIRAEIKNLMEDQEIKADPLFELDSLDLELSIVVSDATDAGFKFFVASAGAKYKEEQVSKIKLSLKPLQKMRIAKMEIKDKKFDFKES